MKKVVLLLILSCAGACLPVSATHGSKPIDATNEIEQIEQETNKPSESLEAILAVLAQLLHAVSVLAAENQTGPESCVNMAEPATPNTDSPTTAANTPEKATPELLTTEEIKQKIMDLLKLEHETAYRAKRTAPKVAAAQPGTTPTEKITAPAKPAMVEKNGTPAQPVAKLEQELGLLPTILAAAKKEPCCSKPSHHKADGPNSIVLSTFASMITSFAAIVANPRNPRVVGASITSMLAGLINIFAQADRKHKSTALRAETILAELIQDQAFMHAFTQRIMSICVKAV